MLTRVRSASRCRAGGGAGSLLLLANVFSSSRGLCRLVAKD
jgi:hypothetical protein